MRRPFVSLAVVFASSIVGAEARPSADPPLLPPAQSAAIANEVSGGAALRNVRALSLHHRMRASDGYRAAAEVVRARLAEFGFETELIELPADATTFYGTQRSRPAWNASFAELWEQREESGRWLDTVRIASWAEQPISLAQDSVSGRAEAELIDVGDGTKEADYAGRDVRGKLVLVSAQPESVEKLAVGKFGAAGIVSWAQNQKTAWWGQDDSLVRWGHLLSFPEQGTFAFMVSPRQARAWQERLRSGESVRLRAEVRAGREPSAYLIPTAVIAGKRSDEEIVYSCHLDHPSPGANDNASGCAGILEVARTLHRLISSGVLPRPERTIRFLWPSEIEATIALLNARPEFARRTLATIHLDMIGGDTEVTKSILRVHGSPPSLPSFVSDVGFVFGEWVNAQSMTFANTGSAAFPLIDPAGSRRALQAEIGGFNQGSDHQVWAEGSWRVPIIYLADWPDRYIHTSRDLPDNLDPTKLRRAIFIAAASGYTLASLDGGAAARLWPAIRVGMVARAADTMRRAETLRAGGASSSDVARVWRHYRASEEAVVASLGRFGPIPEAVRGEALRLLNGVAGLAPSGAAAGRPSGIVYRRVRREGPMDGFGYSWFDDRLASAGLPRPRLLERTPDGEGAGFAYEALNLVDGRRSVGEIRDALAATVGAAPVAEVAEYLDTLAKLGVLEAGRK